MSLENIIYLILLVICIMLSAFFSGTETAFMSLQKVRLQHMVENNVKGAKRIARILEKPERFLSTVLLASTFASTAASALATVLAISLLGAKYGALIATVGLTFILLIFGESLPKTIATRHSERRAIAFARPVEITSRLLNPVVIALSWITFRLTKALGGTPLPHALVSAEEIRTMIKIGRREGTVDEDEAEMLHNVFEFGDRPVREIMVPRTDIVGLKQDSKIADYFALYTRYPLSYIPVYKDNLDNIIGILSEKDILIGLASSNLNQDSAINNLIRPVYFTPESKPVNKLFDEMRKSNYRMAVVVDEYGGTAGIMSFARMAEEVIGEVGDELGTAAKDFEVVNETTFQVDGSMRIDEVNEELKLGLPEGDYETVAGFVLSALGHIPRQGEQFRHSNLKLTITRMQGVKIEEVLITKEEHGATTS